MLKKGCIRNFLILSTNVLLVAQDPWLPKKARKSVKAKKAALGSPHLATTGTEVARMLQVWSQVMAAAMEIN